MSIDYVETTENHPDGLRWESHPLAKPNFASRYHTLQMLFCVDKVGKNATTYWWKIWVSSGINGMGRSLQTNFGGSSVNDFTQFGRSYKVIVQADTSYRSQADT